MRAAVPVRHSELRLRLAARRYYGYYHLRYLCPQEPEGVLSRVAKPGYQVESRRRRPFRGVPVCRRLEEPRPELDINSNPGESESQGRVPGLRLRTQVQVVDGSGPTKKCR